MKNKISKLDLQEKIRNYFLEFLEKEPAPSGLEFFVNKISNNEIELERMPIILKNTDDYKELQGKKMKLKEYSAVIKKPVLIFGVPRSGTTLLYNTLCCHPDLAWFSNEEIKNWIPEDTQKKIKEKMLKLKEENKPIPRSEHAQLVFGTSLDKPFGKTGKVPIEAETFWGKFLGSNYIETLSDRMKSGIFEQIAIFLDKEKKNRFLNKAPQNCKRLYALKNCFPDAKFIHIYRDPRAVISSMIERDRNEGGFNTGIPVKNKIKLLTLGYVEKWAWQYNEITEYIYNFSQNQTPENFLSIQYEDLIQNPVSVFGKILKFCELRSEGILDNIIPRLLDTETKWKKNLTDEDQEKIFQIVKPSLQKMNYPYNF